MAEERNLGLARATDTQTTDEDATKAELQRRMEEARESITQTVTEIKDTVANQYQQVKQQLDWREQVRRRPVEFSAGALGVGLLLGYSVGGAFAGASNDDDDDYESDDYNVEDDEDRLSVSHLAAAAPATRSYAAQPIIGGHASPSSAYDRAEDVGPRTRYASAGMGGEQSSASSGTGGEFESSSRPSYSSGYEASATAEPPDTFKPGLLQRVKESGMIDKFKETKAYDRLQDEISTLGERFVEELSSTAKNVVLPALLGKLKDMIGIDLSMQREVAQRSKLEHDTTRTSAAAASANEQRENTSAAGASGGTQAGGGSSTDYGTSENRGYSPS